MEFFGSEGDSRNIRRGKKPDTAATRVTDDDIACDDDAPVGRRQKHLSADGIAFTAVINVEADDLSAIFRDRAARRRCHLLSDLRRIFRFSECIKFGLSVVHAFGLSHQ